MYGCKCIHSPLERLLVSTYQHRTALHRDENEERPKKGCSFKAMWWAGLSRPVIPFLYKPVGNNVRSRIWGSLWVEGPEKRSLVLAWYLTGSRWNHCPAAWGSAKCSRVTAAGPVQPSWAGQWELSLLQIGGRTSGTRVYFSLTPLDGMTVVSSGWPQWSGAGDQNSGHLC